MTVETKTLEGREVWEYVFGLATSFCAYLKGKERGKLERRAIASANMFLRAHLYIVERFHLELCRDIEGSIIGIGGEEKILRTLEAVKNFPCARGAFVVQNTEDVTKYECFAPECFALFHDVLTNPEARKRLNLKPPGKGVKELSKIFLHTFHLLSRKRIWMGRGHIVNNETEAAHMTWSSECKPMTDCSLLSMHT